MRIAAIGAHGSLPQNPSEHSDRNGNNGIEFGSVQGVRKNLKTQRTQRTAAEGAENCFKDVDDIYGGRDGTGIGSITPGTFFLFDVVFLYPPRFRRAFVRAAFFSIACLLKRFGVITPAAGTVHACREPCMTQ